MANLRTGTFGNYYGSFFGESESLSAAEMQTNAVYIYSSLLNSGWSVNAIAAMLGNIQAESSINPGRWQSNDIGNYSMGYGLVQWTPATKYIDWCAENSIAPENMDSNLLRINYEVENGIQWIATDSFNLSFKEFKTSSSGVDYLAKAFLLNYERPADQGETVQNYRASLASDWYSYLTGTEPTPENPENPIIFKKKKFNFLLFSYQRRFNRWTRRNF